MVCFLFDLRVKNNNWIIVYISFGFHFSKHIYIQRAHPCGFTGFMLRNKSTIMTLQTDGINRVVCFVKVPVVCCAASIFYRRPQIEGASAAIVTMLAKFALLKWLT